METPRTDAAKRTGFGFSEEAVPVKFAQTLEREVEALRQEIENMKAHP